ncbi:xanthine dehydrogenase family protein molybdopterin-binding subunit [candidate division KSB1 bacterium]|nr:xanthine dehydrogenase family protein molybdopterin-binding subunit [candidate division KSB1 bacterium]
MKRINEFNEDHVVERYEQDEAPRYQFDLTRRGFVQILGAGLVVSMSGNSALASGEPLLSQNRSTKINERLHIGRDGIITIMTSKVEVGQGSRTEITQAAAEELKVSTDKIRLIMADTDLVPNDGGTHGSQTTPRTIPAVRSACAAAGILLMDIAAKNWNADRSKLVSGNGFISEPSSNRRISFGELAGMDEIAKSFDNAPGSDISVTPVNEWKVMGTTPSRVEGENIVNGTYQHPADILRPGMVYGKVLRPPAYNATLRSVDLGPARAMDGVTAVHDGNFVGVTAPTSHLAEQAVKAIEKTAQWDTEPHPSSKELFGYLKNNVSTGGGRGFRRRGGQNTGSIETGLNESTKTVKESYEIAYIQHVPMEPRAAVAEWNNGKVTVWTGTQHPFGVKNELVRAMRVSDENVRVIVPDTGGGFGGKHTGEVAIEAARLAREAGKPVSLRWSREEEFTWAYFRPAGLIETRSGIDDNGNIKAWEFINYNSGTSALATPYDIPNITTQFRACDSPLREGSYRGLAATANVFARESLMDELASAAGVNPFEFRLKHLDDGRLKDVLVKAAEDFDWENRSTLKRENRGVGLSCGIEKGSYTAACVEVEVDRKTGTIHVLDFLQTFECGAIINPDNLSAQVEGSIVMGLGAALWEEMQFENGKILNPTLRQYRVPRFKDVPPIEVVLIDRPDLPSSGAGETPIISVAPAIANAVFAATGVRVRSMPIKSDDLKTG